MMLDTDNKKVVLLDPDLGHNYNNNNNNNNNNNYYYYYYNYCCCYWSV